MSRLTLCSAREFKTRIVLRALALATATIAFIGIYVLALVDFTASEWLHLLVVVSVVFPVLFVLARVANVRLERPIVDALSAEEPGGPGANRDQLVSAHAALSRLPVVQAMSALAWWSGGGVVGSIAMKSIDPELSMFSASIIALAATSGGFVSAVFLYFVDQSICRAPQQEIGRRLGDEALRRSNVTRVSLRFKLMASVTGVSVVIVVFAMLLATVHSGAPIERNATRVQAGFLADALGPGLLGEMPDRAGLARRARAIGLADDVLVVDASRGVVLAGDREALTNRELALVRASASGQSTELDSSHAFSWRRVPGSDQVLVAVSDWSTLHGDRRGMVAVFGGLLLTATGLAFLLAAYLSREVSTRSRELTEAAQQVAAGDLRVSLRMEAEDELGDLAFAFSDMARALASAVSGVIGAANHVERAAEGIDGIANVVGESAETQTQGVTRAVEVMESINEQVSGVSSSAQELNTLVEESSSSILEMGAAGEELNDTAGVLTERVDEVSSSIEEIVRSVKEVGTHTGALSDAANDTSSSMEEMASAMRVIDTTAVEAAGLSERAMEAAEGGHHTVQQMITGMESIRSATEAAETVIAGLVDRAKEIGSILDVIDEVADETGLLALNAAIIAAQAGENGRAFSVVADEIKELADRVLSSTKEIGAVIHAVQTESQNAVGAIAEGTRSVAAGVKLSGEAGRALDAITTASRESGQRIQEILRSVQEQSRAAGHVVDMMEQVNSGAEAIHRAGKEQDRGNEVVFRSTVAMREVAQQVRATTEEQARGGARIRASIDGVRDAVESIDEALQQQTTACRNVVGFFDQVSAGTSEHRDSSRQLSAATASLLEQAEALREGVRHFIVDEGSRVDEGAGPEARRSTMRSAGDDC